MKHLKYLFFIGKNKSEMYFFEEFFNENECIVSNQLNELLLEFDKNIHSNKTQQKHFQN